MVIKNKSTTPKVETRQKYLDATVVGFDEIVNSIEAQLAQEELEKDKKRREDQARKRGWGRS